MEFLLDPNIAYLILLAGVLLTLLAIVTPGTGMLEAGAILCIALAGYAVYNLSINLWALILLILSVIPFLLALRKPKGQLWLALSLLGLVAGSMFLFATETGAPVVNPALVVVASILLVIFLWFAVSKSIQAAHLHPTHDLDMLVGRVGEARTEILAEGSVHVAGELWSARSESPIPAGTPIRVLGRDGFVLVVEKRSVKS